VQARRRSPPVTRWVCVGDGPLVAAADTPTPTVVSEPTATIEIATFATSIFTFVMIDLLLIGRSPGARWIRTPTIGPPPSKM
jgi:hypothetical protein